jgi:hypothetical protein
MSERLFWYLKIYSIFLHSNLKANHNKDYSVVNTFKAAQVAFFLPIRAGVFRRDGVQL